MARRKGALPTTTGLRDTSLLHGERGAIKMAGALPLGPFKLGKFEFVLTHRASVLQAAAGTRAQREGCFGSRPGEGALEPGVPRGSR